MEPVLFLSRTDDTEIHREVLPALCTLSFAEPNKIEICKHGGLTPLLAMVSLAARLVFPLFIDLKPATTAATASGNYGNDHHDESYDHYHEDDNHHNEYCNHHDECGYNHYSHYPPRTLPTTTHTTHHHSHYPPPRTLPTTTTHRPTMSTRIWPGKLVVVWPIWPK